MRSSKNLFCRCALAFSLLVCYFSVLTAVSYWKGPEENRLKALRTVQYADFSVLEGAEGNVEIGTTEIHFHSEASGALSGCFAAVPLAQTEMISVSFSAISPAGYGNGILYVDLCADGYDREEQEYRLPLQDGQQKISFTIAPGEGAPDAARLRFFTTDQADVQIQQLRISVLSSESNRNLESALIAAAASAILGMAFLRRIQTSRPHERFFDFRPGKKKAAKADARTVILAAFLTVLYLPGAVFALSKMTGLQIDVTLQGNFIPAEFPSFSAEAFREGAFQQSFEQWWNEAFGLRGVAIKTYNQIRYSAFREGNRVIGKDGSVFEPLYIQEDLGLAEQNGSLAENQQLIRSYVEKLNLVADKLNANGKPLIVYTTANKASYLREEIPARFTAAQTDSAISLADYFRQLREEGLFRFAYLDSYELLQEETDFPIFYKTGIHWSRPAEQKVSQALMERIQEELGRPTAQIGLGKLNVSETPYWRDTDVYDLLNVWKGKTDKAYYEYDSEAEYAADAEEIGVLLVGGSFSMGFEREFAKLKLGSGIYYVNYSYGSGYLYLREDDGAITPLDSLEELELQTLLDRCDVVLLEINEAVFLEKARQDEFLDRLDAVLDVYKPGEPAMTALDFQRKELFCAEATEGFYKAEETHIWSTRNSTIRLRDEGILTAGLELQLYIPAELAAVEGDKLTVFVNGQPVFEHPLTAAGNIVVSLPPEALPLAEGDFLISFQCDRSFCPRDLGSPDERELSFAVLYAGARS